MNRIRKQEDSKMMKIPWISNIYPVRVSQVKQLSVGECGNSLCLPIPLILLHLKFFLSLWFYTCELTLQCLVITAQPCHNYFISLAVPLGRSFPIVVIQICFTSLYN